MPLIKSDKRILLKIGVLVTLIALFVAIYLHAYMGTFTRYIADDFCTAGELKYFGFLEAIINRRVTWDGRYSFSFLIYLFQLLGVEFASILPSIGISVWVISVFYFFKQIAKRVICQPSNLIIFLITLLFTFLLMYSVPQVAENFYWMTGITTYTLAIIIELFLLGTVVKVLPEMSERPLVQKVLFSILFFIFSFICSGFSEVSTAVHVAIFGLLLLIGIIKKIVTKSSSTHLIYLTIIFLGAVLGFVYMAVAPGNTVRHESMSSWSDFPGIFGLFKNTLLETIKYSKKWSVNFSGIIWPICVLFVFIGAYLPTVSTIHLNVDKINRTKFYIIYFVILGALVYTSLVPTQWFGDTEQSDHILIIATTILIFAVTSFSLFLGFELTHVFSRTVSKPNLLIAGLALVFLYFSLSIPITYARRYYLTYISAQVEYAQTWDRVNRQILEDVQSGEQYIVSDNIPYDVMGNERIRPQADFWTNICAARYYQVKEIISH